MKTHPYVHVGLLNQRSPLEFELLPYISLIDIRDVVKGFFKISDHQIDVKKRDVEFVYKRQICHFFGKAVTRYSLTKIGLEFGGKDHATVLHSYKTILNLIDTDRRVYDDVRQIYYKLNLINQVMEQKSDRTMINLEHVLKSLYTKKNSSLNNGKYICYMMLWNEPQICILNNNIWYHIDGRMVEKQNNYEIYILPLVKPE